MLQHSSLPGVGRTRSPAAAAAAAPVAPWPARPAAAAAAARSPRSTTSTTTTATATSDPSRDLNLNTHHQNHTQPHNRGVDITCTGNSHSRRTLLTQLAAAGTVAGLRAAAAAAGGAVGLTAATAGRAAALPLGPLGPVRRVGGDKRTGLSAEEVAAVLKRDLAEGQYFVTGDLTREIFADDCRFVDPTNDVTGLSKYLTALGVLFDPKYSKVELLDIRVTDPRVIEADWRLGGYLVFPWNPRVEPFTGHTIYTLNEEGLVSEQRQSWSISGATALQQSFTPSWGPRRQLF
ncbi:hypothetical protein PLESTB_001292000 [Pleodorina starrii]|uniref:Uncharacterized protein n=1 Tax=Pleodorina starrii TaxID=330485 RepID=A0A9W6BT38_9CHLO|nr:hypothetical protein PLESTM_000956900 [Pleodorina starrii]GLC57941.1 hypothetical protein PLESTB_001292000 [Pleodorina starrii]